MLEVIRIDKKYKDGTEAISNISFKLGSSGLVYIKGKSGSGKTTLLNIIAGLSKPSKGIVKYNSIDINKINNYYKNTITYITQEHSLLSFLTVEENLKLNSDFKTQDNRIIDKFELKSIINKKVCELSGGEAKRVEILKSYYDKSEIVLCDEPLNYLDSKKADITIKLLKEISKSKLVIITGHNVELISKYADKTIEISDGSVVSDEGEKTFEAKTCNHSKKYRISTLVFGLFKSKLKKNMIYILLFSILYLVLFISLNTNLKENEIVAHALIDNNINKTYITSSFDEELIKKANSINTTNKEFTLINSYYNRNDALKVKYDFNETSTFYQGLYNELKFSIINKDTFIDKDKIIGSIPNKWNEILLSEYYYECLKHVGIFNEALEKTIGSDIKIGDYDLKVVGFLKQDLGKYSVLKKKINYNNQSLINLENMFIDGIVSKDTIYVTKEFENNIKYDYRETIYLEYSSDNYNELLLIKNKYKNNYFDTDDMYTNTIRNQRYMFNIIKNISLICIIIVGILLFFTNIDYINHIVKNYEKDIYNLCYLGFNKKYISFFISYFMLFLNLISAITGIIGCSILIPYGNSTLSSGLYLNIDIINFNYLYVYLVIAVQIVLISIITYLNSNRIYNNFLKRFI